MKLCLECNKENPSIAKFCMHCGCSYAGNESKSTLSLTKVEKTKKYRDLESKYEAIRRENENIIIKLKESNITNNQHENEINLLKKDNNALQQLNSKKNNPTESFVMAKNTFLLITLLVLITVVALNLFNS